MAQHLQRFLCSQGPVSENLEPLISTSNQTTIIANDELLNVRFCEYVSATTLWLKRVALASGFQPSYIYIYIIYICVCVGSRENLLHPSRALSLSRVLWKSAYWRSNMNPKSIPKQARKWIEELFCRFQVLRQHFMFLSCCIHLHASSCTFLPFACISLSFCIDLLSLSFHVPFIRIHFPSFSFHIIFLLYSFHVHSNVHSCPFIFLSFACMFLSFCVHVLSFPS